MAPKSVYPTCTLKLPVRLFPGVILMVPDTPDVEALLFGENGLVEGLSVGKTVIDMSSISPVATQDFAARIGELGCGYLDAPVSGGEAGAKGATLSIMVGDVGAGQTAKVANQIIVALTIGAVSEGLLFASKAGADPAKVREALMGGLASSKILEMHGQRMLERAFAPGFRISLHQKDINNALESARSLKMALPATAIAQELFNTCAAQGHGELDHSALIRPLETMAAHEIGKG